MKTALLALAMIAGTANAAGITLGAARYGGNGCPAGSASVTLSPDQKSLSIIFDQFMVEAGGINARVGRKSCNIAIPVKVPSGLSVSIMAVDYRGFNSLPAGARSTFSAEYFFAGFQGPKASKTWYGPVDSDYTFTNNLQLTALNWSPCGQSVNMRVNAGMTVIAGAQEALSTVDSADFSVRSGIVYKLTWRSCR